MPKGPKKKPLSDMIVDGYSLGDPELPAHPLFTGSFRGYFNVPPGPHTLVARWNGKESVWKVSVARNEVHVKRISWSEGGWIDDNKKMIKKYQKLASSGAMLQSKALRSWPLPSLFFKKKPKDLKINGIPIKGPVRVNVDETPYVRV